MGAFFCIYQKLFGAPSPVESQEKEPLDTSSGERVVESSFSQEEKERLLSRLDAQEKELSDLRRDFNKTIGFISNKLDSLETRVSFLDETTRSLDESIEDLKKSKYAEVIPAPSKRLSENDFHAMSDSDN